MCESRASIWRRTVHWTQCNCYEGMWRAIQIPSRYLTIAKEKCLLSDSSGHCQYHSQLIFSEIFCRSVFICLYTRRYWGAYWSLDAACETREGVGKECNLIASSCISDVNASGVLVLQFPKQKNSYCS